MIPSAYNASQAIILPAESVFLPQAQILQLAFKIWLYPAQLAVLSVVADLSIALKLFA